MGASSPAKPGTSEQRHTEVVDATDSPWVTIVWDDPVNLMNYVTYVFQKLFGYSEPHATKLMLQVHNEGKAVVSSGSRESMEVDVTKPHAAGLVGHHAAGPLRVLKWKRVETAEGPRFRSALAPHEAALLKNMVTSIAGMLTERQSSAPTDPLEEITGIRTGHSGPPEESSMRRLLPDFIEPKVHGRRKQMSRSSTARCAACTSRPSSTQKQAAAQRVLDTATGRD